MGVVNFKFNVESEVVLKNVKRIILKKKIFFYSSEVEEKLNIHVLSGEKLIEPIFYFTDSNVCKCISFYSKISFVSCSEESKIITEEELLFLLF